jgi:hypothetical protein
MPRRTKTFFLRSENTRKHSVHAVGAYGDELADKGIGVEVDFS